MSNTLHTLDLSTLDSVTGGKTVGASSTDNSAVLSTLQGLQSSIKDLSNPPKSTLTGTNALLFAILAMNRPAQTNVVYVHRRGWW